MGFPWTGLCVVSVWSRSLKNVGISLFILASNKVAKEIWVSDSVKSMRSKRFGSNVSNIKFCANMTKPDKLGSNSFAYTHDRAGKMFLLDLGGVKYLYSSTNLC